MKKLIILLSLLLSIQIIAYSENYNKAIDFSVSVISKRNGNTYYCSGVVIKENYQFTKVLTCKHCAVSADKVLVEGQEVILTVVSTTEDLAVMIVKGSISNKEPVKFASHNPSTNERIKYVGYPKGRLFQRQSTITKTINKDWYYANLGIIKGCSGGGVFNKRNKLVGIIWGRDYMFSDLSMFEPIEDIEKFLKEIRKWKYDL